MADADLSDDLDGEVGAIAGGGDIALEVLGEERDPRRRTPEGRADVDIAVAIEFAEVKLSMSEMIYHMDTECHLIEGEQRARLLAGTILEPTEEQIGRIARHLAVINFLKRCKDRPAEAADHFAAIARRRQNG